MIRDTDLVFEAITGGKRPDSASVVWPSAGQGEMAWALKALARA